MRSRPEAPRPSDLKTPLQPNSPNVPVFGGMKGVQFRVASPGCLSRYQMPNAITARSTETFRSENPAPAKLAECAGVRRNEGRPIPGRQPRMLEQVPDAECDHGQKHRDLPI